MDKKHEILQPSGYDEEPVNFYSEVFADKKPIKTTGTTCDAFSARFENLHVFVKQLKPEFRSNPKFREAFRKEYEIGFPLNHSSLPRYIRFLNGDTIVIEFVDGRTLHDLIKADDPWIHEDSNIETMVGQLLNVMDYLHRKNILHCDIKTDNIMITNDTRNLMLVDFDKAFTASQDLTPGTPLNYGTEVENLTKRQMDMRGVRTIIEKLLQYVDSGSLKKRLLKVERAAGASEMTMPELLEIWHNHDTRQNKRKRYISLSLGTVIFIGLLVIVWSYLPREAPEDIPEVDNSEIIIPEVKQGEIKITPVKELDKEERKPVSPDWNSLLATDVRSMNKLLDEISDEIQKDKIKPDSVVKNVLQISDEMNSFNKKVMDKYSLKYPELGELRLMEGIYESEPVKLMAKRRDNILRQLLEIQETN